MTNGEKEPFLAVFADRKKANALFICRNKYERFYDDGGVAERFCGEIWSAGQILETDWDFRSLRRMFPVLVMTNEATQIEEDK